MSEKTLKSLKFHGLNDIYKIPSTAEDVGATPASHLNNSDNPHNVTAAQVGARPSNWTPTAAEVGAATPEAVSDAKMEAINESKAHTIQQVRNSRPYNLLDNSNFRNPVNQRGKQNYRGKVYGIDRWKANTAATKLDIESGYIKISKIPDSSSTGTYTLIQYIEPSKCKVGAKVTLAARVKGTGIRLYIQGVSSTGNYINSNNWTTVVFTTTIPADISEFYVGLQCKSGSEGMCEWIALYEGVYTEEALPEYQPKGYAAELLECQRYFLQLGTALNGCRIASGIADSPTSAVLFVPMPVVMREAKPTFKIEDPEKIYFQVGDRTNIRDFAWNYTYPGNVALGLSFSFNFEEGDAGLEYGAAAVMVQEYSTSITLDAELVKEG